MQGGSGLGGVYSGQAGNGSHFPSQEESQMDLDEFAKHIGIKVSENLISPGGIFLVKDLFLPVSPMVVVLRDLIFINPLGSNAIVANRLT